MKTLNVVLAAALLLVASPVLAGSGEKCTYDTQSCLNHWAAKKDAGWAGLEYDKSVPGVIKVKAVTAGSPAAAAGFQPGDVLVALNGAAMSDKAALKKAKGSWKAGQSVTYTVQRAGAEQKIALTLAKTPDEVFSSMAGAHMLESHAVMTTAAASTDANAAAASSKK
jgi:S1-C subfamily serine protease